MKISNPLRRLLTAIATTQPLHLPERTLRDDFGPIRPPLQKLGFLRRLDPCTEIACPGAADACLRTVTPKDGKFYVNCDCEEGVGFIEVAKEETERFGFDLLAFLKWLSAKLGLSGTVRVTEDADIWLLGDHKQGEETATFYFLRTDDPKQAQDLARQIQKRPMLLLWLGESPHAGAFAAPLISLPETLSMKKDKLNLDMKPIQALTPSKVSSDATDVVLDKNIVLHAEGEKHYLLFERNGNAYRHQCPIRPQAARLIRFLYDVRNRKDHAYPLDEFVYREFAANKTTISTRILEVNLLCEEYEAMPILKKYPGGKWGLNQQLSSCR